jgi:hypothetical protein
MFTFWMMLTFDNACSITTDLMQAQPDSSAWRIVGVAFFFISFQLAAGFILMNIVMAVLLDEFSDASDQVKLESEALAQQRESASLGRPLDPLLQQLVMLGSERVEDRLQAIFETIDEDGSGSIEREELRGGLARLEGFAPRLTLGEDDLDRLMRHAHPARGLAYAQFSRALREDVRRFELRFLGRALSDRRIESKADAALLALRELRAVAARAPRARARAAAIAGRLDALEGGAGSPAGPDGAAAAAPAPAPVAPREQRCGTTAPPSPEPGAQPPPPPGAAAQ